MSSGIVNTILEGTDKKKNKHKTTYEDKNVKNRWTIL